MRRRAPALRVAPGAVAVAVAVAVALGGCDWVDSTGVQPGEAAGDETGAPALAGTDVALDDVAPGEGVGLLEAADATLRLRPESVVDEAGTALQFAWEEAPLAEGALEPCTSIEGFDPARAPSTLAEACTDPDDCGFAFERIDPADGADGATFALRVPRLRSPIGRRHALVGLGPEGDERSRREFDLCLVAINEAPLAVDDAYETGGGTLELDGAAGVLANDEDDVDTGNAGLTVATEPLEGPTNASFFELRPDGGFTWTPLPAPDGEGVEDGFRYEVSDGVHVSSASVSLLAVTGNRPPVALEGAPPVIVRVGEFAFVDLSGRFTDPDGDALSFAFPEGLPDDGSLGLARDGVLSGVPGFGDAGEYALTLVADDGTDAVGTPLLLVVEGGGADEAPPPRFVPGSTFDQTLRLGQNIATVRPDFEGGAPPLSFESGGEPMPPGVVVDPDTGRVAGRPRETGRFQGLAVLARDANGAEAVSDEFSIRVR